MKIWILLAGVGQLALALGSLAIPRVLRWREDVAKLRRLTQQVFWTYAAYIWCINVSFGLISALAPESLLDGSTLARSACGFIAAYWGARVLIQIFWFDRTDVPRGAHFRLADFALTALFVALTLVYGWAAVRPMDAYLPRDPGVLAILAWIAAAQILLGYALARSVPRAFARTCAWLCTIGVVVHVDRVYAHEPPGLRMLAFIASAMLGLKVVVLIDDRSRNEALLPFARWLGFALGWPGMRPQLFAHRSPRPLHGVRRLATMGAGFFVAGALLQLGAREAWSRTGLAWLATAVFFLGSSFLVHFGVFDLLAAAWRARGVACDELFRAPWKAQCLSEFWSKRWNLAFSEMTSIAVYRPLSRAIGRNGAMLVAFVVSGLLHEMAISLPVRAGYGLPTAYFALHGVLVWIEHARARRGRPVRGMLGRVWTLGTLILPLPILFHRPFLEGVVWPLLGTG